MANNEATRFSVANVEVTDDLADEVKDEVTDTLEPHPDDEAKHALVPPHRRVTLIRPDDGDRHSDSESNHQISFTQHGTQYLKSLRNYLTRDALPSENHYRNIMSLTKEHGRKFSRPTLEELHANKSLPRGDDNDNSVDDRDPEKLDEYLENLKGKVVKFGWIKGVFMRCLLNIWGVMLFLRLSWVVGQCGIVQGVLVIVLCNCVTTITAISMSAVSTNGQIKGGGIYYMISRSLGPEFGGAIGIMFTIANSIAVATYLIGFCDSLIDMLFEYHGGFNGIVGEERVNDVRLIGAVTLVLILILAIVGMEWVTRVQMLLLVLLVVSQLDFVIGSFLPAEHEKKFGFVGYSSEVFVNNLLTTNYHSNTGGPAPTFFEVFGVFFPAVTGIVAGANLSGDLKDPAVAIPKGTLSAIFVTFLTYVGYGVMIGACYLSEASGVQSEYEAFITGNTSVIHFNNCTDRVCLYGSSNDQQTLSKISFTGFLVYAGCFAATLSSAIASLVGAPRVLQALANDDLYPFLKYFGKGFGANNDPFRGYILVFFVALGCTMLGNLDVVSSLLSNFFVAAYALINFSVFHSTISRSPGWRPSFKYYNEWLSLLGTILCVAVMFLMSWATALITLVIVFVLYFFISYRKPEANWGSSTQAQQFLVTLRGLQGLNEASEHVKNYRPKILVFSGPAASRGSLIKFANEITKKSSLLICAQIEEADVSSRSMIACKTESEKWLSDQGIKAFCTSIASPTLDAGALSIMSVCGLGRLSPNMIMLGFKKNWTENEEETEQYVNIVHQGFGLNLAVGILRLGDSFENDEKDGSPNQSLNGPQSSNQEKSDKFIFRMNDDAKNDFIDVWWLYDDGGLTMLLPYILSTREQFSKCKLRVFALANRKEELDRETRNIAGLLSKFRIDYTNVTVVPDVAKKPKKETLDEFEELLDRLPSPLAESELNAHREKTHRNLNIAQAIRNHSKDSAVVIATLPMLRMEATPAMLYMAWLEMMTKDMPPFLLVRGNQTSVLTFYS